MRRLLVVRLWRPQWRASIKTQAIRPAAPVPQ